MASEQVEMRNGEDDTSSSESDVDAEEKAVDSKIQKLILESEANPYQYDKHIELITALRSTGDLEQLRNAREAMSNVYPLSEELWLEWFQDELPLAVIPELKEYLLTRFELAVKDYASTKVWHEYCQFAMNNIESPTDIDRARNVFERAITAAGLHITEGASIWDGYREFEIAILDSYQQLQDSGDTVGMDAKVEAQIERIATIFKRQLSVPLIGMENVFSIYKDWSPEPISDQTKRAYDKASQKLTLCMEHEEKLHNATEGKLELYKSYIAFEIKSGDPTRIQCIFERAIKDNCLQHDLWISYTNYLDYKLKIPVVCVPVHERAIRNCPWVCQLWVNYLRAMERNNEDYSKVKDVFDRSLKGGFPNAEDYLKVWIAMCDYHRRSITDWNIDDEKVDELRKTFENGITYMNHYFGLEGDKYCTLMREWAFIEAKYLQNVKRSQELWDTVMKKHARDSNMWLEYVQFLMLFTDTLAIRKVFQRCVQITLDSPEPICEEFIRFERRFGSLYEVDDAQQKVEVQLKKLKERREKEALKDLSTQKPSHDNKKKQNKKHEEKKKKKRPSTDKKPPSSNKSTPSSFQGKESLKRSIHQTFSNEDNHQQPNVKKSKNDYEKPIASSTNNPVPQETVVAMETIQTAPQSPHAYQTESILQSSTQTIGEPTSTQPSTDIPRDEQQPAKHLGMGGIMNRLQEMATAPTATDVADKKDEQDKVDNERSVFLSNLLFSVDDQAIRQMFSHCGDINTVRIITNRAGKSKGFAYLEFKDKESVSKALVLDRTNLNCRPVFVSNCVDKKENPTKFKFPTTIDKHTLYVSNIAFEVTEDQLRDEFQQIGNLKQVRLVTNRSGKFKGYAYVEYENETDAKSAILKFDQYMFHGRPMNVAISNPPARKNPELQQQKQQEQQHQKSATKTFEGPRGKAKTQISLVPRAVQKSTTSQQQPSSSGESEKDGRGSTTTNVAKSNADFRQFLLKK